MATQPKRAKQAKQQRDSLADSYVPAKPRPLNRPLIIFAVTLFCGWLTFLVYTAIRTVS
ncbi:MAG: hypothetical protein VB857_07480 [Pirellulaceae bacterium]